MGQNRAKLNFASESNMRYIHLKINWNRLKCYLVKSFTAYLAITLWATVPRKSVLEASFLKCLQGELVVVWMCRWGEEVHLVFQQLDCDPLTLIQSRTFPRMSANALITALNCSAVQCAPFPVQSKLHDLQCAHSDNAPGDAPGTFSLARLWLWAAWWWLCTSACVSQPAMCIAELWFTDSAPNASFFTNTAGNICFRSFYAIATGNSHVFLRESYAAFSEGKWVRNGRGGMF